MQFKTLAFLSILSILFFVGCDSKDKQENKSVKTEVPVDRKTEFVLTNIDNSTINLSLDQEKIVVKDSEKMVLLAFFATWCPPCKAEIPNLIKLQTDYQNDFEVIAVLLEDGKSNEEIKKFAEENNINYTVVNSSENYELAKSLGGIKSIPTMFLIKKGGEVFQKYVGIVPSEMMEIDIKKVLEKE